MKKFLILLSAGAAFALTSCATKAGSCCGTCKAEAGKAKTECCGKCKGKAECCGTCKAKAN